MSSIITVRMSRKRDRVSEIAQPVEDRYPGAAHLLDVEAEVDEILPRDAPGAAEARELAVDHLAADQIERHAPQPELEIGLVHGVEPAAHGLARFVYGFVLEGRHAGIRSAGDDQR
jgi:hypothetical protein